MCTAHEPAQSIIPPKNASSFCTLSLRERGKWGRRGLRLCYRQVGEARGEFGLEKSFGCAQAGETRCAASEAQATGTGQPRPAADAKTTGTRHCAQRTHQLFGCQIHLGWWGMRAGGRDQAGGSAEGRMLRIPAV
jgi:hypothetical protein